MSENKRTLFSFTKMNKYYLIPFITPVFSFISNILEDMMEEENSNKLNFLFFPIVYSITDIIAGLIYFIQLCQKNKNLNSKKNQKKENKNKIFCIIIFMSFLAGVMYIGFIFLEEMFLLLPFSVDLILTILFSKFLLKINIYSHQILSIIISCVGFIFILLFSNMKITLDKFYFYIIISILHSTFISILKYSTITYFISPFLCSFLYGIISLIIYIIGIIIGTLYNFKELSFMQYIHSFSGKMFIIYFSLFIILSSIKSALTLLEIYYFSPILFLISETISPMLYSFYKKLYLKNNEQSIYIYIFIVIGFLFEIISILLYNEIIIINAYGLNKNTVKYIKEREIKEKEDLLYDNDIEDKNDDKYSDNYLEISHYIVKLDSKNTL